MRADPSESGVLDEIGEQARGEEGVRHRGQAMRVGRHQRQNEAHQRFADEVGEGWHLVALKADDGAHEAGGRQAKRQRTADP